MQHINTAVEKYLGTSNMSKSKSSLQYHMPHLGENI